MAGKVVLTSTTDDAKAVSTALERFVSDEPAEEAAEETAEATEEEAGDDGTGEVRGVIDPDADDDDLVEEPAVDTAKLKGKDADPAAIKLEKKLRRANFETYRAYDAVAEARAVNAKLMERIEALEGRNKPAEPAEPELPKFNKPEPRIEDAETIDTWTKEYAKWSSEKAVFDLEARRAASEGKTRQQAEMTEQQRQHMTIMETHNARVKAFAEAHPDFEELAIAAQENNIPISNGMLAHITQSETGPAILYYLAKNPNVATELSRLPMGPMLVRLGRIEAKLEEQGQATGDGATGATDDEEDPATALRNRVVASKRPLAAATDRTSPPPKPPAKLASVGGKNTKDPSKMSYREFKEWRAKGGR